MTNSSNIFIYTRNQLLEIAEKVLVRAKELGATDAVTEVSEGNGLSIMTRCQQVEKIEYHADKSLGLTVFFGKRRGSANTADFSDRAIKETVEAAFNIAQFTAEDTCAGLPDVENFLSNPVDLDLFFPWMIDAKEAVSIAKAMEFSAFNVDKKIQNSDGASISTSHRHFLLANSRGFVGGYPISRHFLSCAVVAANKDGMQRDGWYSTELNPFKLKSPAFIGEYAANRALARLGAKSISTVQCPVLFEAPVAASLVNCFVRAVSGSALYRKTTFLLNSLEQQIFPRHISVYEDPLLRSGPASAPFDDEGVQTRSRLIVERGVLKGYFLSTYSAKKLGMETTGNAGGAHNLYFRSSLTKNEDNLNVMFKKLGTGLFVTELMGDGVNLVTGDYSRCASGFWIENGEIAFPVEEVTIAGNLSEMFKNILAVGSDCFVNGNKFLGSVLIEKMTIAGHGD